MFSRSEGALSRLIPFASKVQQLSNTRVSQAGEKRHDSPLTVTKRHRANNTSRASESSSNNTEGEDEGEEEVIQYLPVRTRKRTKGKHQQSVNKGNSPTTKSRRRRRPPNTTVHRADVSPTSSDSDNGGGGEEVSAASSSHVSQSRRKPTSLSTNRQKDKRVKLSALDQT